MSTTRPRKESTILAPIDIGDQPVGTLIFLTEGAGGTQAFSVDLTEVKDEVIYGYRNEIVDVDTSFGYLSKRIVIAVPVRSPWTVLSRDAVIFRTLEESMQKQKSDQEQTADLVKSVFGAVPPPPGAPQAVLGMPPLVPPVGHYL
jgi:hypothetical protein